VSNDRRAVFSDFAQRAALYSQWDHALSGSTRFYAAAALINEVFAECLSGPARVLLSAPTVEFFITVSRALQGFNVNWAFSVGRGGRQGVQQGAQLDTWLVHVEQVIVERCLRQLYRAERRAYGRVIREANAGLRLAQALAGFPAPYPSFTTLGNVLRQLHRGRGQSIDFAQRSDREAVGNALIVSARRAVVPSAATAALVSR
jgi:hypothetical protein